LRRTEVAGTTNSMRTAGTIGEYLLLFCDQHQKADEYDPTQFIAIHLNYRGISKARYSLDDIDTVQIIRYIDIELNMFRHIE